MIYPFMTDCENLMETGNAYKAMMEHGKNMLLKRDPEETASKAGVKYDNNLFYVPTLGQTITVSYPHCKLSFYPTGETPSVFWSLAVLHYLATADGTPLSENLIPFRMLKDGMIRGGNFDREGTKIIGNLFGGKTISDIENICGKLGADFIKTNADATAVFPFLPRYPLIMKIWLADDELPCCGQILLDSSAIHYLSMEDSVTAGSLVLELLSGYLNL